MLSAKWYTKLFTTMGASSPGSDLNFLSLSLENTSLASVVALTVTYSHERVSCIPPALCEANAHLYPNLKLWKSMLPQYPPAVQQHMKPQPICNCRSVTP